MGTIILIIVSLFILLVLDYSLKLQLNKSGYKEAWETEEDLYSSSMDDYYNNMFMDHIG